ncbi:hypothetical protein WA538_002788 [Blastocystis sp. DL]
MSGEIAILQEEKEFLQAKLDAVREELDAAMLEREKLSSTVSSLEERVRKLQRELEDSLSENIKLYEISSKGADEIVDGALLVKLQSENARLKQCIVQLYSSNTNKESSLESELSAMKDRVHQLENAKQADWSIKAAKYLTEIASLKDEIATLEKRPTMSEEEVQFIQSCKREKEECQQLYSLDTSLLSEYKAIIEEDAKQLTEKEATLQLLARAYQSLAREKEQTEFELHRTISRVLSLLTPHSQLQQYENPDIVSTNHADDVYQQLIQSQLHAQSLAEELSHSSLSLALLRTEKQQLAAQLASLLASLPPSIASLRQPCDAYARLLLLRDLADTLLRHQQQRLRARSDLLAPALLPGYCRCLLYLAQLAALTHQYAQIVTNPHLPRRTKNQLLADSQNPVATLLQLAHHLVESTLDGNRPDSWSISSQQIAALNVFQQFLRAEGARGDAVWRRNRGALAGRFACQEMTLQLQLLGLLLRVDEQTLRRQESFDEEGSKEILAGIHSLAAAVDDTDAAIAALTQRVLLLEKSITEDGFLGVPLVRVEGDEEEISPVPVNCLDNSGLWEVVDKLREETKDVFRHMHSLVNPQKSLLFSLIVDHQLNLLPSFMRETTPSQEKKTVLNRILHLRNNVRNVSSRDLFVTGIVNPSGVQPEPTISPFDKMASELRQQLEAVSVHSMEQREQELTQKVKEAELRTAQLQRDVSDLTASRTQLLAQLAQRKEVVEVRASSNDESSQLRQALDKKQLEMRALQRESARMKKELAELRVQSQRRPQEEVGGSSTLFMRRSVQMARAEQIRGLLRRIPDMRLKEPEESSIRKECLSPALLLEATKMQVMDVSGVYPSNWEEKQRMVDAYSSLTNVVALKQVTTEQSVQKTTVMASIRVPPAMMAQIPSSVVRVDQECANAVLSNAAARRIHRSVIESFGVCC